MKTFHNDPKIKQKYIDKVKAHQETDDFTLESYNYDQYLIELGIPQWITHLEDVIFQNLPDEEAKDFPLQFMESMPVGATQEQLYKLHCDLDYQRLSILLENLQEKDNEWGVRAAIEECMRLNKEYVDREDRQWSEAHSSTFAAHLETMVATYSARSVVYSAIYSADEVHPAVNAVDAVEALDAAVYAANATRSALYSADTAHPAAYSVVYAARSAAEASQLAEVAWRGERDRLLAGLKNL